MDSEPAETRHLSFLFADVEGSTRLMERHGADAGDALSRYHDIVASTASRHGGKAGGGETFLAGSTVDELGGILPDGTVLRNLGSGTCRSPSGSLRWCILPALGPVTGPDAKNPRTGRDVERE